MFVCGYVFSFNLVEFPFFTKRMKENEREYLLYFD